MAVISSYRLAERVYDQKVQYVSGSFTYYKAEETGGSTFSSPPQAPQKPWNQKTLRYEGNPQKSKYEAILKVVIPGEDGRTRILNTTELPYSIHVQLSSTFEGQLFGGSGSLVGPHHLLTCGHNVYDPQKKIWADKILAYPALNKKSAPFGVVEIVKAYTFTDWTNHGDHKFDIALLILNQSIGFYTGWGGLLNTNDQALANEKVHITGYPGDGDKNCDEMWSMSHTVKTIYPEHFDYEIDTYAGQSGSAIWISKYALPMIIGVHTRGSTIVNSGVRISAQKFTTLVIKAMSETQAIVLNPQTQPTLPINSGLPPWKHVSRGLNMEGTCTNRVCQAFNQKIVIQKGLGHFSVSDLAFEAKCPTCSNEVDIDAMVVMECQLSFSARTRQRAEINITNRKENEPSRYDISSWTKGDITTSI